MRRDGIRVARVEMIRRAVRSRRRGALIVLLATGIGTGWLSAQNGEAPVQADDPQAAETAAETIADDVSQADETALVTGDQADETASGEPSQREELPRAIHLFSPNAPFTKISFAGSVELDEDLFLFDGSSLRFSTDGDGANVHAALSDIEPIDIANQTLVVWVRVDSVANLNELRLYLGNGPDFADRVVYLIDRDRSQLVDGTWLRVSLSPSEGQPWGNPDRSAITSIQLWVNDRGSAPVQVWFDGLSTEPTPDSGAVVITFDDGWVDQVTESAPILAEYDFPAVAYIIPELIGTEGYLTMGEVRRLQDEFGWTIGSHAAGPLTRGDSEQRADAISTLLAWFAENGFDETPHLSYPNGAFDGELLRLVGERFRSARTIVEFAETIPPGDPHRLRIFNVLNTTTMDAISSVLSRAQTNRELLVLVFHRIADGIDAETVITPDHFREIVDIIASSGLPVVSLDDVPLPSVPGHIAPDQQAPQVAWDETRRIDLPPPAPEPDESSRPTASAEARSSAGSGPEAAQPSAAPADGARQSPAAPSASPAAFDEPVGTASERPAEDAVPVDSRGSVPPAPVVAGTLSFGLDMKFVIGRGADGRTTYLSQVDELFLTLVRPLGEFGTISAVAGVLPVTFRDLTSGSIRGDNLYIDEIVVTERFGSRVSPSGGVELTFEAGYRDYSPVNKWAQVTQWSVVESPFAQDLTAKSLWLGAGLFTAPFFARVGVVPDLVGVLPAADETVRRLVNNPNDGMPQLFFNVGGTVNSLIGTTIGETALAVGGDAVKWVAMLVHRSGTLPVGVATSLGWKATWGTEVATYPRWEPRDHGQVTVSGGISPSFTFAEGVAATIGVSFAHDANIVTAVAGDSRLGLDLSVGGAQWLVFAGLRSDDIRDWHFGADAERTAGGEAGVTLTFGPIAYTLGYTTAGYSMRSVLYANRLDFWGQESYLVGGDGFFMRVQTAM